MLKGLQSPNTRDRTKDAARNRLSVHRPEKKIIGRTVVYADVRVRVHMYFLSSCECEHDEIKSRWVKIGRIWTVRPVGINSCRSAVHSTSFVLVDVIIEV